MKQPSDKVIRAAVLRFTKAEMKWMECALAHVGSDSYYRLLPKFGRRKLALNAAKARLLALGMRLIVSRKVKRERA